MTETRTNLIPQTGDVISIGTETDRYRVTEVFKYGMYATNLRTESIALFSRRDLDALNIHERPAS